MLGTNEKLVVNELGPNACSCEHAKLYPCIPSLLLFQEPNAAHKAIAELEARLRPQERKVTVVTQNIDRLHHRAGSQNVIELHGEGHGLACRLVPRPSPMRCSHLSIL